MFLIFIKNYGKIYSLKTVIKNDTYESLKEYIICPKCKKIILEPVMCSKCENHFCKKCIDKKNKCPNGCKKVKLNDSKKNFIKKLKFKCIRGCGTEIPYDDITDHYKSDCDKNNKMKFLSKEQMSNIKREDISYVKSKFYKFVFIYCKFI